MARDNDNCWVCLTNTESQAQSGVFSVKNIRNIPACCDLLLVPIQEANAAMGLNGQMLGDRALKVENAKSARETTPQGATNPYTAIQLQQMQQLQLAQMQSSTLAAQVSMHAHPRLLLCVAS